MEFTVFRDKICKHYELYKKYGETDHLCDLRGPWQKCKPNKCPLAENYKGITKLLDF